MDGFFSVLFGEIGKCVFGVRAFVTELVFEWVVGRGNVVVEAVFSSKVEYSCA